MFQSAIGRVALAAVVGLGAAAAFAFTQIAPAKQVFYTEAGIGPDKWASVWLIRRHIAPEAEIVFVDVNATREDAVSFDVTGADYMRTADTTTFEVLLASDIAPPDLADDPAMQEIARIINEMEVSRWMIEATSATGMVEDGFRNLQFRYDRESVPFACYMAYFDSLQAMLERNGGAVDASITDTSDRLCDVLPENGTTGRDLVAELPVRDVLGMMDAGKKVVFVDTREKAEFDEFHIPGAVHMPLREVSAERLREFVDADLVIPYCVKDFRGYEVARAMASHGVGNVAILNPYGIRGWRDASLPTVGTLSPMSEAEATVALADCAADPDGCLP